jgi:hypothetical protein
MKGILADINVGKQRRAIRAESPTTVVAREPIRTPAFPLSSGGFRHDEGSAPRLPRIAFNPPWMRPTAGACDRPSLVPTSASDSPFKKWSITASRWSAGSAARAVAARWSCSFRSALRLGEV